MSDEAAAERSGVEDEDDSEWEYEYHETETEDFFVTIDLSSYSPHWRPTKRTADAKRVSAKTSTKFAQTTETEDATIDGGAPSDESVQILGLDSENPLVLYKSQLYSCDWATTLGTDVLLAAPEESDDAPDPLRSLPEVDVLATTRIKLVARPAKAIPRSHQDSSQIHQNSELNATAPAEDVTESAAASDAAVPSSSLIPPVSRSIPPVEVPLGKNPSLARQNQGAFLGQLISLKEARGEHDKVPVIVSTPNQRKGAPDTEDEGSSDKESRDDDDVAETSIPPSEPIVDDQQSISKNPLGSALATGTQETASEEPSLVERTPERWTDLDGNSSRARPRGRGGRPRATRGRVSKRRVRTAEVLSTVQSPRAPMNEKEKGKETAQSPLGGADWPQRLVTHLNRSQISGDVTGMGDAIDSAAAAASDAGHVGGTVRDGDVDMPDA